MVFVDPELATLDERLLFCPPVSVETVLADQMGS